MKTVKIILCTFTAVWLPLRILAGFLGLKSLVGVIAAYGEIPGYVALVGIFLLLHDLWKSEKTHDQKLWWTVVGVIFAPIAVPAYWFGYGLKNNQRVPESTSSSPERLTDADPPFSLNESELYVTNRTIW